MPISLTFEVQAIVNILALIHNHVASGFFQPMFFLLVKIQNICRASYSFAIHKCQTPPFLNVLLLV